VPVALVDVSQLVEWGDRRRDRARWASYMRKPARPAWQAGRNLEEGRVWRAGQIGEDREGTAPVPETRQRCGAVAVERGGVWGW